MSLLDKIDRVRSCVALQWAIAGSAKEKHDVGKG